MTDRYSTAIEHLGSENLAVRIGAIYALERIARDSRRDHPAIMDVLSAFIREESRKPLEPELAASPSAGEDEGEDFEPTSARLRVMRQEAEEFSRRVDATIPPDVQTAVTVIGRRDPANDTESHRPQQRRPERSRPLKCSPRRCLDGSRHLRHGNPGQRKPGRRGADLDRA